MSLEVPGWSTNTRKSFEKASNGMIGLSPAVIRRLTFTNELRFVSFDSLWHSEY